MSPVMKRTKKDTTSQETDRNTRDSASSAPPIITVPLTKLQCTGVYPKGSIDTPRADRS